MWKFFAFVASFFAAPFLFPVQSTLKYVIEKAIVFVTTLANAYLNLN